MSNNNTISTSELKAHCSRVIAELVRAHTPIIVTKRGRPVAKLVPLDEETPSLFGCAKGSITVVGDIIEPIDVRWEADG